MGAVASLTDGLRYAKHVRQKLLLFALVIYSNRSVEQIIKDVAKWTLNTNDLYIFHKNIRKLIVMVCRA